MRRPLLNAVTACSLLFCFGAAAMWVRSCWARDGYYWARSRPDNGTTCAWSEVYSLSGGVCYCRGHVTLNQPDPAFVQRLHAVHVRAGRMAGATAGFNWRQLYFPPTVMRFDRLDRNRRSHEWYLWVPYWLLVALGAVLPAGRLARRLRRRPAPGACARCGYDLTGNQSGTCPECGTVCGARHTAR